MVTAQNAVYKSLS